jgi:hypothetical protein
MHMTWTELHFSSNMQSTLELNLTASPTRCKTVHKNVRYLHAASWNSSSDSFLPPVSTVHTIKKQRHASLRTGAENNCFILRALRASNVRLSWQCGVAADICQHDSLVLYGVLHDSAIHAPLVWSRLFNILRRIADKGQLAVNRLGIQQIICLWAETESHNLRLISSGRRIHGDHHRTLSRNQRA